MDGVFCSYATSVLEGLEITSQNPVQNRTCEAQIATKAEGAGTAEDGRLSYSPVGGAPAQAALASLAISGWSTNSKHLSAFGQLTLQLKDRANVSPEIMTENTGSRRRTSQCCGLDAGDVPSVHCESSQGGTGHGPGGHGRGSAAPDRGQRGTVSTTTQAPKKLICYIDNQVVSTKGEKYKVIRKPESEEVDIHQPQTSQEI
ncbi:UNVERIFIED_CONTAM: hypothetical protein K2H54_003144 [Gekko kuhli]